MKKIIALGFSDFHLAIWNKHNEGNRRTLGQLKFLNQLKEKAFQLGVPLLFSGDFFHDPKEIPNELLNLFIENYDQLYTPSILGIPGNHDQCEVNYVDKKSPDYINWFCNFDPNWWDVSYKWIERKDFAVGGIPFIKNNRDYLEILKGMKKSKPKDKKSILLIHTNLPGAKEPNGLEIDDTQNIGRELHKYFKGFDLVLSGHIHRHQKLAKNVYMMGATSQQRTSDSGCKMGYIEIYNDLSIKFIDSKQPEFKYIPFGTPIPEDYHFYIEESEEVEEQEEREVIFSKGFSPTILGKKYLKIKGEKNKSKKNFLFNLLKTV